MPDKKKVAYLSLEVTREGRASHAHVHEIIKGLRKRGWQVNLSEPSYTRDDALPGPLKRLVEFLRVQLSLLCKARKVDAIYIRAHFAAFLTALWARLLHIPTIQEVNGPYEDLFIAWPWTCRFAALFRWLTRTQLKWADAIVVVTPQLREWLLSEVGQRPVHVIPNGANTDLFNPEAVSKWSLPKPYVVFFGSLGPWQGVDTLLEAVEYPKWPEDVRLVIVGRDGVERSKVEEAAGWNPKVIYRGQLPYREVSGVVASSIAGLCPKNNMGDRSKTGLFPLKVFETLACGVPVIVTDFPGQADLVRAGKCGLVISSEDAKALAEAVAFLYNHPQERKSMGQRGRELVVREHSWDGRAEETAKVLKMVIGGEP